MLFQGANRDKKQVFLASDQSLAYLDGSLPGDFGFDPLGLMDPEGAGEMSEPGSIPKPRRAKVAHAACDECRRRKLRSVPKIYVMLGRLGLPSDPCMKL